MSEPDYDLTDPDAVSFCPSCGAGYSARAAHCVDCEERLLSRIEAKARVDESRREISCSVDEARVDEGPGETDLEDAVHLCRVTDRLRAAHLESQLDEACIPFLVKELDLQPLLLQKGIAGRFDFFVTAKDLFSAQGIVHRLEEFDESLPPVS